MFIDPSTKILSICNNYEHMDDYCEGKFSNIFHLLSENKFQINENVPGNLICNKCNNLIADAVQTPCGCRYCRYCIEEMVTSGQQVCSGNSKECKSGFLSNISLDYRANNKISNLELKCPENECQFRGKLISMDDHLKMCDKKKLKCIFYEMGCKETSLTQGTIDEHFILNNYHHNKILTEIIENIKNEIYEMRKSEETNRNQMKSLSENTRLTNVKNESWRLEVQFLKNENSKLENRVSTLEKEFINKISEMEANLSKSLEPVIEENKTIKDEKQEFQCRIHIALENIWKKIDEIDSRIDIQCANKETFLMNDEINSIKVDFKSLLEKVNPVENNDNKVTKSEERKKEKGLSKIVNINSLQMEIEEISKKIEVLQFNFERHTSKCSKNMKNVDKSESKTKEIKYYKIMLQQFRQKMDQETNFESRINQLERCLDNKRNGTFEWTIDNLSERKKQSGMIKSEYFYLKMKPYKMRLGMRLNNIEENSDFGLRILLFIYEDIESEWLEWPFSGNVTIKVTNKNKRNISKTVTKYCEIPKPKSNEVSSSDRFNFLHSELVKAGLLESNSMTVQCFVELK